MHNLSTSKCISSPCSASCASPTTPPPQLFTLGVPVADVIETSPSRELTPQAVRSRLGNPQILTGFNIKMLILCNRTTNDKRPHNTPTQGTGEEYRRTAILCAEPLICWLRRHGWRNSELENAKRRIGMPSRDSIGYSSWEKNKHFSHPVFANSKGLLPIGAFESQFKASCCACKYNWQKDGKWIDRWQADLKMFAVPKEDWRNSLRQEGELKYNPISIARGEL